MDGFRHTILPLTLAGFVTSCLRRLEIGDLYLDLDSIIGTRNLTHLSLLTYRPSFGDSGMLLAVLQANPFLECIRFINTFGHLPPGDGFSRVPLPHLRTIDVKVSWTRSQLSWFFECLELSVNIEEIKLTTGRQESLAWIFNAVYPAISPGPVQHLLIHDSLPYDTAFHYYRYPSDGMSLPQTAPFLIFKSDDIPGLPLGELERYNVLSSLPHLEVRIFQRMPRFKPVFEMTKTLEKLTVWIWNHCRGLFDVLYPEAVGDDANSTDVTEEASSTSPARVQLLLQVLKELIIIEANFRSSDSDTSRSQLKIAVTNCFRVQKQHGSSLEVLKLIACHDVDPGWVEELEEVVQHVFWDGLEDRCDGSEDEEDRFKPVSPQPSDASSDEEEESSESE